MGIKTVKFGGSSLADAEHFKKVADIIKSDPERRYVVPSAPGKRNKNDTKVTDMLYETYRLARSGMGVGAVERPRFCRQQGRVSQQPYTGEIPRI